MELASILPKKCPTCGSSLSDIPQIIGKDCVHTDKKIKPIWICISKCSQSKCSSQVICAFQYWEEYEGGSYRTLDPRIEEGGFGRGIPINPFGEPIGKFEIKCKLLWTFPNTRWQFDHPELIDDSVKSLIRDAYDCFSFGKMLGAAAYARTCVYSILDSHCIPEKNEEGKLLAATDRLDLLKKQYQSLGSHIEYLKTVVWLGGDFLHLKHEWDSVEIEKVLKNIVTVIIRLTEDKRFEKELSQFANIRGKK